MHFPRWFRYMWWVIWICGVGALIYLRWGIISTGQPEIFDTALLAIGAALVLIPFFSEFTLLGLTIKQKTDDSKTETVKSKEGKQTTTIDSISEQESATDKTIDDSRSQVLPPIESGSSDELIDSMLKAIEHGNISQGEGFFKRLQDTETDAVQKLRNEGLFLYFRYIQGESDALDKLNGLVKRTEKSPEAHTYILWLLGIAYETSSDHSKAIQTYSLGIPYCTTADGRARFIIARSKCLHKLGDKQKAFDGIIEEIEISQDSLALCSLYQGIADLYKEAEQWELRAIALERALAEKPNDTDTRFSIAYAYSESKLSSLSILHYKSLTQTNPKYAVALNNLAVEYDRLKMNIMAVSYYKRAVDIGHTLASANLAYQFMNAGFVEEAQRVLDEARKQPIVHANIGSAIAALSTKRESENKQESQIIERAIQQQRFITQYADALFLRSLSEIDIAGEWISESIEDVFILQDDRQAEITWVEEKKKYKISGYITNRVIKATFYQMSYYLGDKELSFSESGKAYVYLSKDLRNASILVVENSNDRYIYINRRPRSVSL